MKSDDEGFLYPFVDQANCIECGLCEKVCPIKNTPESSGSNVLGYAAKAKDNAIRMSSSSGGIFYLLASNVINKGGVVFGAALVDKCMVRHIFVDSITGIERLQRSKYVQSDISDTFKTAKSFLDKGRLVLFSGTPCQIAGFEAFLGRDYDTLITQDIACHGVPAPLVYRKYKEYLSEKENSILKSINFREKSTGWYDYSLALKFENGNVICESHNKDIFMLDYLYNYSLRPSCYDCKFKGIQRCSDITLADFWGIDKMMPEMFDDIGVSLVMIQSEKGKVIFDEISDKIDCKKADCEQAAIYNTAIVESVKLPVERKMFFRKIKKSDYSAAHTAAKRRHLVEIVKRRIIK